MAEEVVSAAAAPSPVNDTGTGAASPAPAPEQTPAPAADPALAATPATQQAQEQTATKVEEKKAEPSILDAEEEQHTDDRVGAPEGDYDLSELKVAEGQEVDKQTAKELGAIAKELNLSQKAFNTLFNKASEMLDRRQAEQLAEARTQFLNDAKADKDIGGANWKESITLARRAVKQFADDSTKEYMRATGLDCHPGVIRMFRNIGRAVSEDAVVKGEPAAPRRDAAKAFFYNSKMN